MELKNLKENEFKDDPIYLRSRKEAMVAMLIFIAAGIYTLTFCFFFGYYIEPETVRTLWGIPSWVVWGVGFPWIVIVGVSVWFGAFYIQDEDLGEEPEDNRYD